MRYAFVLLSTLIFSLNCLADTLSFAVVPQQSAKKLAMKWTPILKYLSEHSGHNLTFATAKDIPKFESRLAQSQYDLAYMNPYHFVVFNQQPGYQALIRQKDKVIKGILVVRKDSDITSLEQLQQQKLAFPAPAAFAASIIPRSELSKAQIQFTPRYVSSHDSVYLNVAKGFFPAGGGVMRTFNNTKPEIKKQLRILWTTQGYTPHAIAVHPRVDHSTKLALREAFIAMNTDPQARDLLDNINFKLFETAKDKDWDDVRQLGIQSLQKPNL